MVFSRSDLDDSKRNCNTSYDYRTKNTQNPIYHQQWLLYGMLTSTNTTGGLPIARNLLWKLYNALHVNDLEYVEYFSISKLVKVSMYVANLWMYSGDPLTRGSVFSILINDYNKNAEAALHTSSSIFSLLFVGININGQSLSMGSCPSHSTHKMVFFTIIKSCSTGSSWICVNIGFHLQVYQKLRVVSAQNISTRVQYPLWGMVGYYLGEGGSSSYIGWVHQGSKTTPTAYITLNNQFRFYKTHSRAMLSAASNKYSDLHLEMYQTCSSSLFLTLSNHSRGPCFVHLQNGSTIPPLWQWKTKVGDRVLYIYRRRSRTVHIYKRLSGTTFCISTNACCRPSRL